MRIRPLFSIVASLAYGIPASWGNPDAANSLASKVGLITAESKPHDRLSKLDDFGRHLSEEEIGPALATAEGLDQWRERGC